jgi:hypothetical protein
MVDVALGSYFQTPASEPKLTNTDESLEGIMDLMFGKAPRPNGILNTAVKDLTRASGIAPRLYIQRYPPQPSLSSSFDTRSSDPHPKTGEWSRTASSYRPISLMDTIGKLFEKILLSRILYEVGKLFWFLF